MGWPCPSFAVVQWLLLLLLLLSADVGDGRRATGIIFHLFFVVS
jgi:hypothetical protein